MNAAWTTTLLPLRAVTVRLRLQQPCLAPFFHQAQLMPFLKELLADKERLDNDNRLWLETPESGQTVFRQGDHYRFTLFCSAGAYGLFLEVLERLRRLPVSYPSRTQHKGLFDGKFEFDGLEDYFTRNAIQHHEQLFRYDQKAMEREQAFWQEQPELILRFTSPTRFKRKLQGKTRNPYLHDRGQIQPGEIERRVYRALSNIVPDLQHDFNGDIPSYLTVTDQLFWTDNAQTLQDGKLAPFGGVMGTITLSQPQREKPHLALLILGQYTGIGERRCYGLGRYRLETAQGQGTLQPITKSQNYLTRSAQLTTLELACDNIQRKHPYVRHYIDYTLHDFDPDLEEQLEDDSQLINSINLHELAQQLREGNYQASTLQGVILRAEGRRPRPLAIPPLQDRIVQRAVVEVMGVDIDQLASNHSYGYRRGLSRLNARDQILLLNRQGYQWFFETDIAEFFDLVSHAEINNRLSSFFPDEPLIPLILAWIKAPVYFEGQVLERPCGLPQGSPISPMLANLLLEDFDADLEAAGMKLVRFADDLVILCKNQQQALQAAQRAEQSLKELGLHFNVAKTRIGTFSEGFQFLGYTFLEGFAVENQPRKSIAQPLQVDNIPTASWLAQLVAKQPQLLEELNQSLEKKHRHNDLSPIINTAPEQLKALACQQVIAPCEFGTTLFITGDSKYLHQQEGCLEVMSEKTVQLREHWHNLAGIVLFGRHEISHSAQIAALQHNVPIHFCTTNGRYLGLSHNAEPSNEGSGLWLQQQQRFSSDSALPLNLSRQLVAARIHNQMEMLRQRLRSENTNEHNPLPRFEPLLKALANTDSLEQIRGYEGQAAALYFDTLAHWVPEVYGFSKRVKRPATDPFNALLSLGYTILYSQVASIARIAGLYPWIGFYHQPRGRHLALASDMMEPFRHIIERTALTMLRTGQLKPDDFIQLADGAYQLSNSALKNYLGQLNQRLLKPIGDQSGQAACTIPEQLLRQSHQLIRAIRDPQQTVTFFKLK